MLNIFAHLETSINDSGLADHMVDDGHHATYDGTIIIWIWALILCVALIVWLVLSMKNKDYQNEKTTSIKPLDIVKARYAKGEITKKQYDEIKKELK